MNITETEAKSILRKNKKIDSWFITHYSMNLYIGCSFNCSYCDGRAESYYVPGEFGKDISVKTNAIKILRKELDPKRKRKPLKRSFILPGGGICDSYEPTEKKYELTKQTLELLYEYNFPVHILTKSTLVERDIDLLKMINEKNRAIVSFSFSSVDDKISSIFEPLASAPSKRLATIEKFKKAGLTCGMYLMPVIPFITDTPKMIDDSIRAAKNAGVDFIVFSGMTLKEGRQKDYFMNTLNEHFPQLSLEYETIYQKDKWGNTSQDYYEMINFTFNTIAKKYKIPKRIPAKFYNDILSKNDLVVVILDQIDFLLKSRGYKSQFGYASYAISKLDVSVESIRNKLGQINGIGNTIRKIIWEILDTGTSQYYEKLLID